MGVVRDSGVKLVEITGGEPLLQEGVYPLVERLLDSGYTVLVETNGSMSIRKIDRRAVLILDIKTRGAGMSGEIEFSNLAHLKQSDEIKFVLTGRADYEWAKGIMSSYALGEKCHVLFSPAYGNLSAEQLAGWRRGQARCPPEPAAAHYIFGPGRKGV